MPANKLAYYGLTAFMAALTSITAQIRFYIGPIPYTMQNFAIVLSGLILPPFYAFLSQILYLLMIALGLPVASNFSGGLGVLFGYTAGYLWGFPIASLLVSVLSRLYLKRMNKTLAGLERRDLIILLGVSFLAVLPMYLLGYFVFLYYALPGSKLYSWATSILTGTGIDLSNRFLVLFVASVLVFVPQDLFMDHLLAIITAKNMVRILYARGLKLS